MDHLKNLNERQKEAVLHKDGPILIVAGAGAGKTMTITHRILHLIKSGVNPSSILAITFTNKSAKEMKDRVSALLASDKELNLPISNFDRPFVSTFHSLGVHILKDNALLLGLSRHFNIFDRDDSKRAVKEAIVFSGLDPKQYEPGKILSIISKEKGNFVTAPEYDDRVGNDYFPRIVAGVWNKYEEILRAEKSLDFDDLLLKTAKLLQTNNEVREKYSNIWKYIHIDEYQDTNKVQYKIAKLLAQAHQNICVVGDADQNIYGWRGAEIKNILNFEKDFPGAITVLLEENYRSTKTILDVANIIIKKNKVRKEKNLFTNNIGGELISMYEALDEGNEANFIAKKSADLIAKGVPAKEIAVLFRANFQSRALEEGFLKEKISYQVIGTRFFERKEVRDLLSFLKASLDTENTADLKRIVNVPPRGLGKVAILKIFEGKENELPAGQRAKIADLRKILADIKEKTESLKPSDLVKFALKASGIEDQLKKGNEEDLERLENIKELATIATKYDDMEGTLGVEQLLTDAALASDQDDLMKGGDGVRLMTVHASKGLEFDYVFIGGLEENLFPHQRFGEKELSDEESEEERRLFYVAITRARKKIYLSYAGSRMIFGQRNVNVPSEFVMDIDDKFLEREAFYYGGSSKKKPLWSIEF